MRARFCVPAMCFLTAVAAMPQTPAARPEFEVASIKPNISGTPMVRITGGLGSPRFAGTNMSLRMLITLAYNVKNFEISGGNGLIDAGRYDIEAKTAAVKPTQEQSRQMLQALLEDRFKLMVHRETREMPEYALVAGKGGTKLAEPREGGCVKFDPASPPAPPASGLPPPRICGGFMMGPNNLRGDSISMMQFVGILSTILGRPVIDKTGYHRNVQRGAGILAGERGYGFIIRRLAVYGGQASGGRLPALYFYRPAGAVGAETGIAKRTGGDPGHRPRREGLGELMKKHPTALWTRPLACALVFVCALTAAENKGQVKFGGLPVPGVTVTATQGDRSLAAITDQAGNYVFPDLPDGVWNFQVEMLGFAPIKQQVTITNGAGAPAWDLKMLPFDQIKAQAAPPPPPRISLTESTQPQPNQKASKNKKTAAAAPANLPDSFQRAAVNANPNAAPPSSAAEAVPANSPFANQSASDLNDRASNGLLINGTTNNGASSPFAQAAAFGNNRRGPGSLYNGGIGVVEDNSTLDANSFSYTGQNTPKPGYNHVQGLANFGGPFRIPHLLLNGPQIFLNYQWMRNHNAQTNSYQVPTEAQRGGDFIGAPPIYDPTNRAPFDNNRIPMSRLSPQALALLNFYPMPNLAGSSLYNYQLPIVGETHQDALRAQANKNIGNRNSLYGFFAFRSTANDNPNEFGFLDKNNSLGINTQVNWQHRFNQRMFAHFQVEYSRLSSRTTPYFANRENVSAEAGIPGNNQNR